VSHQILGLDIGSYSLKGVLIQSNFRNFEVVDCYLKTLPISEGNHAPDHIARAIYDFMFENTLQVDSIHVGISGTHCSSHTLMLPFHDKRKIEQTITFEIEDRIPFNMNSMLLDFAVFKNGKSKQNPVHCSLLSKGQMAHFLSQLSQAEIDPEQVTLDSLSLARLLQYSDVSDSNDSAPIAIVDIGFEKTNICVLSNGMPKQIRSIDMGGKLITNELQTQLNCSFEEAEIKKMRSSRPAYNGLEPLLAEMRRTFLAYRYQHNESIHHILLCGGSSMMPEFSTYLSHELNVSSEILSLDGPAFKSVIDEGKNAPLFMSALSYALSGISNDAAINFRKDDFSYKHDMHDIQNLLIKGICLTFFLVVVLILNVGFKHALLSNQIRGAEAEIIKPIQKIFPNKKLKNSKVAISILRAELAKVTGIGLSDELSNHISILDILKEISTLIPSSLKIDVDDMSINNKIIRIRGKTDSFESVDRMKTELEKSNLFESVEKGNVASTSDNVKKFNLTIKAALIQEDI